MADDTPLYSTPGRDQALFPDRPQYPELDLAYDVYADRVEISARVFVDDKWFSVHTPKRRAAAPLTSDDVFRVVADEQYAVTLIVPDGRRFYVRYTIHTVVDTRKPCLDAGRSWVNSRISELSGPPAVGVPVVHYGPRGVL